LQAAFAERSVKGEIVLLVDRAEEVEADEETIAAQLRAALLEHSLKDAAAEVAQALNLPRRQVYQMALTLEKDG